MYSSTEYVPVEKKERSSTIKWIIGLIGLLVVCGAVYKLNGNYENLERQNMLVNPNCPPPGSNRPGTPPNPPSNSRTCDVSLYRDVSYRGFLGKYLRSSPTPVFGNDQVSSFRLKPGCKLVLYEHVNYGGKSATFYTSDSSLVGNRFNDILSSFKLSCYVELFEHIYYRGRSYGKWTPGESVRRFSTSGSGRLNDQASSAKVGPGCILVLYEHWDFRGQRLTLTSDESNFVRRGWNDKASSLRVSGPRAFSAFSVHHEDEDVSQYTPEMLLNDFESLTLEDFVQDADMDVDMDAYSDAN